MRQSQISVLYQKSHDLYTKDRRKPVFCVSNFKLTKIDAVLGVQVKLFETYFLYVEDNFAQHNNEMHYFYVFNYKSYQRRSVK